MPKPRASRQRLALTGTLKDHPGRYSDRKSSTPEKPIGPVPRFLSREQKQAWHELVRIVPLGLLGDSDRIAVELAARLLCRLRDPSQPLKNSEMNLLLTLLSKLGMTPTDRQRLTDAIVVPEPSTSDPWAEFDEV